MEVDEPEEESDSEVEEEEDVEESAIEKTRQAVRDALGVAGSVTDTVIIFLRATLEYFYDVSFYFSKIF